MATVVVDEANRIVEWNTAACLLLGYEREEALGREVGALIACAGRLLELQEWFAGLRQLEHAAARTPFETRVQRANGEQVPVRIEATRTMTTPPFFVVTLRDLRIGEMVDLNHPCVVALVDASTDAVAILSPDGLVLSWNRAAEELYGYQAGEALGQRLASLIVPAELMHEPDRWLGEVRSGRVVEAESRRLRKDRREVLVSVRLAPVRGSRRSVVAVVMIARDVTASRLYPDRHARDRRTAFWQRQIDAAIRSDAFAFAAQPVVDLRGGAVDHYELMLRMRTRERLLRPRDFIPEAEQTGQVRAIDLWTLRHGLELAREHRIALHISALSLASDELLAELDAGLQRFGLDASRLIFEITETAAIDDLERARAFAERLTALGCRVALDDFGTGFGAFTCLDWLPVGELKIDRAFVGRVATNEADRRIVSAIVAVARGFGARTVADGVEDEVSRQLLAELGVDLAQGYLLGAPFVIGTNWHRARPEVRELSP